MLLVTGAAQGVLAGAQTLPVKLGWLQLQPAGPEQPSAVLTHAARDGTHQYVQLPVQPGGGGGGGGGGT